MAVSNGNGTISVGTLAVSNGNGTISVGTLAATNGNGTVSVGTLAVSAEQKRKNFFTECIPMEFTYKKMEPFSFEPAKRHQAISRFQ